MHRQLYVTQRNTTKITQVLVETHHRQDTKDYISHNNLPHMHKIILQTPKNVPLKELASQLSAESDTSMPPHYLWIEQPENIPTCLAIAPNRKPAVRGLRTSHIEKRS